MIFILAFICGSIPFGVIFSRILSHKDIRNYGSKNIGATNVLRVVGKKIALLTLVCDFLKGAIPTYCSAPDEAFIISFLCVLGHVFCPWLKFKGGKGIATALGGYSVLFPLIVLCLSPVWGILLKVTKTSSISSLMTFGIAAVILWFVGWKAGIFGTSLWVLFLYTHKENLKRLKDGEELKI